MKMFSGKLSQQAGIGIVEIMVSIAIGLFILAGVLQLYATSSTNAMLVAGSSTIQENARYALARLEQDIRQAGYAGCFSLKSAYPVQYFSDATGDSYTVESRYDLLVSTLTGSGEENDFSKFVYGQDDQSIGGITYDTLTVRYVSAKHKHAVTAIASNQITVNSYDDFKNGEIAAIGDCSRVSIFEIINTPSTNGYVEYNDELGRVYQTANDAYGSGSGMERAVAYLYGGDTGSITYTIATSVAGVAVSATCSSATPQYCALLRDGIELIEGVEQFDIEYGWQDADNKLYFESAASMNDARWFLVDRVKVTATFNSIERAPTNDGDELLKRTYSRTFLIQNQLPSDVSRVASGGA